MSTRTAPDIGAPCIDGRGRDPGFRVTRRRLELEMSTGYLLYELLAAQAGVLLVAAVAGGLAALLLSWRRTGAPTNLRPDAGTGQPRVEWLAWPAAPARQADPDGRGAHRPRAPDLHRIAAA
jgi:hypothetical protein